MSDLKEGTRVKIKESSIYYNNEPGDNPLCEGVIVAMTKYDLGIKVKWDNGSANSYNEEDLEAVPSDLLSKTKKHFEETSEEEVEKNIESLEPTAEDVKLYFKNVSKIKAPSGNIYEIDVEQYGVHKDGSWFRQNLDFNGNVIALYADGKYVEIVEYKDLSRDLENSILKETLRTHRLLEDFSVDIEEYLSSGIELNDIGKELLDRAKRYNRNDFEEYPEITKEEAQAKLRLLGEKCTIK